MGFGSLRRGEEEESQRASQLARKWRGRRLTLGLEHDSESPLVDDEAGTEGERGCPQEKAVTRSTKSRFGKEGMVYIAPSRSAFVWIAARELTASG